MSDLLRYTAKLVTAPESLEARWQAGRNDRDEVCRLALARRRDGEIAILKDHNTGETWRVEVDGDGISRVPL
jgi:hypothetical protein